MIQYIPLIGNLLDKLIPDADAKEKAKNELSKLAMSQEGQELSKRFDVLIAEAKSEHWIVAAWRPITMLTFTAIVANNYILAPYINLFFSVDVTLTLPPSLWDLLKIGLGGYVVGRSSEKCFKYYKESKVR